MQQSRNKHAPDAIPMLSPQMLAYDQVHVDAAASEAVAAAFGTPYMPYDAYGNLTWASRGAFLKSVSDPEEMFRLGEDEIGRIDNSSRRHSLMRRVS